MPNQALSGGVTVSCHTFAVLMHLSVRTIRFAAMEYFFRLSNSGILQLSCNCSEFSIQMIQIGQMTYNFKRI